MPNSDPLLEFNAFIERQNNFYLHFIGEERWVARIYRKQESYQRCLQLEPSLAALSAEMQRLYEAAAPNDGFHNPEFQKKLYAAYQLMRPHVEKDWILFR